MNRKGGIKRSSGGKIRVSKPRPDCHACSLTTGNDGKCWAHRGK